jgi:hypothetical protein
MQKGSFKPGDNIMPQISVKTYDAVVQAADRQPTTTTDGKLPAQQPVGAKTYNHPASRAHMAGFLKLTSYATFAETVKTICYTDFRPEPALFLVVLILEIRRHPTKDYLSAYLPHLESMLDLTGLDTYMGPDLKYAKDCTCTLGVALYAFLISAGTCDTPTVPTSATFASNLLDLFTDMGFVFPAEVVTNIRERVRYVHTMHRACAQASDREKGDLAALLDSVVQREPSPEHTSHVLVEICRMFPILSGFTMDRLLAAHKYVHDGGDINSIPWSLPIPKYEPRLTGKQAILNHLIVKYGSSKPCRDCKYGITPYLTKLKRCMDFPTITVAGVERFRVGELTPFDISRILKQFNDLLGYQHESLADLREDIAAVSACVKKGGGSYLPDLVHKLCAPRATCDQVSTPDVQKYIARTSGVIDMKKFRAICYKTECGKGEQFWYPHDMYMRCWIALGYAPTPDEYILFVAERYCPLPGDIVKVAGDVWSDYTVVRDLDWIITDVTRQYTGKYPDP